MLISDSRQDGDRLVRALRNAIDETVEAIATEEIARCQKTIDTRVRAKLAEISATICRTMEFESFGTKLCIKLELNPPKL